MTSQFDVCIRGAGVVGQSLALMLANLRLRVGLVQSPSGPSNDVRAFALNAASRQTLEGLRCWPAGEHATEVQQMRVWGDQGGSVQFDAPPAGGLTWIVDVPELQAQLALAVGFQPLISVLSEPVDATLTVICEGRHSSSREHLYTDWEVLPYGQHAVAARVLTTLPHQGQALQWFDQAEHGLSILALLPMGGAHGHSAALVWSVAAERAQALAAMSAGDFEAALNPASHQQLGQLTLSSERQSWPLQLAQARAWTGHFPNGQAWVLAGDAAHTVHPLAGLGLNLGLADAAELRDQLQTRNQHNYWRPLNDKHLLRSYERSRKAGLWPTWVACDSLQRLFAHPNQQVQAARNWGMKAFDSLPPLKQWVMHRAMNPHQPI